MAGTELSRSGGGWDRCALSSHAAHPPGCRQQGPAPEVAAGNQSLAVERAWAPVPLRPCALGLHLRPGARPLASVVLSVGEAGLPGSWGQRVENPNSPMSDLFQNPAARRRPRKASLGGGWGRPLWEAWLFPWARTAETPDVSRCELGLQLSVGANCTPRTSFWPLLAELLKTRKEKWEAITCGAVPEQPPS